MIDPPGTIRIHVAGRARTKGSLDRRMQDTPASKAWRRVVSLAATRAMKELDITEPMSGPLRLSATFWFERPKRNRDVGATSHAIGDIDKLSRNILDALSSTVKGGAGLYVDDAQIVELHATKAYCDVGAAGVDIRVTSW